MKKIKITSDGLSVHTKIAVVDDDGAVTQLDNVEAVQWSIGPGDGARIRVDFCFHSDVEIEVNASSGVAERLLDIDKTAGARIKDGTVSREIDAGKWNRAKDGRFGDGGAGPT